MSEEQRSERRIRVLIAKPGLDGHDVGAKLVSRALMDAGMEVIYTGLRVSPEAIARAALCRKVKQALEERRLFGEVLWLVGGNVPRGDQAELRAMGVDGVFPTGTPFEEIARFIKDKVPA